MSRNNSKEDFLSLAQTYVAIVRPLSELCLKKCFNPDIVNHQVPPRKSDNYSGCTALHLAYEFRREKKTIDLLLESGADVTIKNDERETVLHYVYGQQNPYLHWESTQGFSSPTIDFLLDAQLASGNALNPRNGYGLSHFHIACMTNHARAVEFFLANGEAIDQQLDDDAKYIPGYGPLHLAVRLNALEVAAILVERGANVHLKEASGLSPVHLCLKQNIMNTALVYDSDEKRQDKLAAGVRMMRLLIGSGFAPDDYGLSTFHLACALGDIDAIKTQLGRVVNVNHAVNVDAPVWPGYTALHFAARANFDSVMCLLKSGADIAAEDASGTSPFDVCVEKYSIADLSSNLTLLSDGKTKLVDVISSIASLKNFRLLAKATRGYRVPTNSRLWPGYSLLHVAVAVTRSAWKLQVCGGTALLKRVRKIRPRAVTELLRSGADVAAQDAHGSTPVHLAFRLAKLDVLACLLRYHPGNVDPRDSHDLTHLHVACAAGNGDLVEELIANGADIEATVSQTFKWYRSSARQSEFKPFFVVAGSTALHVAVASRSESIVKTLVNHGADLHARDEHGMTPIHKCIAGRGDKLKRIAKILMESARMEDRVVGNLGLSHLHVACHWNDTEAIERLIDRGADVNATINDCELIKNRQLFRDPYSGVAFESPYASLRDYLNFRPISFVLLREHFRNAHILVQRGADVLARIPNQCRPDDESKIFGNAANLLRAKFYLTMLKEYGHLRDRMRENLGMTLLHVGCYLRDVNFVRDCLDAGEDVNARIREDSSVFPGCTALHVFMSSNTRNEHRGIHDEEMFWLLMNNGADVEIVDANGDTPIHTCHGTYRTSPWINQMFDRCRNFGNNSIGSKSVSLLHIACLEKNTFAVEQFLKHGANANRTVDYLSELGGYTPLHAVVKSADNNQRTEANDPSYTIIDLLLNYGANVNAKTHCGDTPLHVAAFWCCESRLRLLNKLTDAGADIHAMNLWFESPFEILMNSRVITSDEIDFFLMRGCRINVCNPLTRTSIVSQSFQRQDRSRYFKINRIPAECVFRALVDASVRNEFDDIGRTVLHNLATAQLVASNDTNHYVDFMNRFIEQGCDVDCQDNQGKTPIHLAVDYANNQAVSVLLSAGADINILDVNNKTAYAYAVELYDNDGEGSTYGISALFDHTLKLRLTELFIHEINSHSQNRLRNDHSRNLVNNSEEYFKGIIEKAKGLEIGFSSVTLFDVISETGVVAAYPMMLMYERKFFNDFFKNVDRNPMLSQFDDIKCLIKLQYRQALKRVSLINTAKDCLTVLFQYWLPDMCRMIVLRYLSNAELKNMIASVDQ